jgi:hypothetical protein
MILGKDFALLSQSPACHPEDIGLQHVFVASRLWDSQDSCSHYAPMMCSSSASIVISIVNSKGILHLKN